MKLTFKTLFVALLALAATSATAQVQQWNASNIYGVTSSFINAQPVASRFNYQITDFSSNGFASWSNLSNGCNVELGGGLRYSPWSANSAGVLPTVKISDLVNSGNTETVALNSANCTNPPNVVLSLANGFSHSKYIISSGTCGLREALNFVGPLGPPVLITKEFYDQGCTAATITSVTAAQGYGAGNAIHDLTNDSWYNLKPTTLTAMAAPTLGTLNSSTTGGTVAAGTYRVAQTCVDALGGETLIAADAPVTTTTATSTISAGPPTGCNSAAGYRLYITGAGGGTGTENLYAPAAAGCTQNLQIPSVAACALTSSSTVTAIVSGTAVVPAQSTAHASIAFQPYQGTLPPPQFQTSYGPFTALGAISTTALAAGEVQLPAGVLNTQGKKIRVCGTFNITEVATGVPLLAVTLAPNFGVSPVTLATFTMAAPGAVTTNEAFCVTGTTAATGTSGTIEAHGYNSQLTAVQTDGNNAASSAIDLTKQLTLAVTILSNTANATSGTLRDLSVEFVN